MPPKISTSRKEGEKPVVKAVRLRNQQKFLPKSYILTIATKKSSLTVRQRSPQIFGRSRRYMLVE
jgi:hypothetical protein